MDININSGNFNNTFIAPDWDEGEVPTSTKLNTLTSLVSVCLQRLNKAMGNIYSKGIPNVASAIGDMNQLTSLYSSATMGGTTPAMFNVNPSVLRNLVYVDEVEPKTNGKYRVRLNGHIGTQNIRSDYIINTVLVLLDSTGSVTNIYNGTLTTTTANPTTAISDFYIEMTTTDEATFDYESDKLAIVVTNQSLSDILVEIIRNIGNVQFASFGGYTDASGDIQIGASGTSLTTEINRIESKPIAVRWRVDLSPTGGGIFGDNRRWTMSDWLGSSIPNATIAGNIITAYTSYTGASLASILDNSIPGEVWCNKVPLAGTGDTVASGIFADSSNSLQIEIPTAYLSNVGANNLSVFVPIKLPFNYTGPYDYGCNNLNITAADAIAKIIGRQYGYGSPLYPGSPIADRLDQLEAGFATVSGWMEQVLENYLGV
jgi:hypothetical protein